MTDQITITNEILGRTNEGRILYRNSRGGVSSELSITVRDPRDPTKWINLPSIYGGKIHSSDDAIDIIIRSGFRDPETGRPIESFSSLDEAVRAAKKRSKMIKPLYDIYHRQYGR